MARTKKEYLPTTSDIKILLTVSTLNERGEYPLPLGVYKILIGSMEPEFILYQDLPTYRTLVSYSSKHISRLIMMLLRNNYLKKIYDKETDELYLGVTDKTKVFLVKHFKKHKYPFVKKELDNKPLIVKINREN